MTDKVSVKVGKLSRTLAEQEVAAPVAKKSNEREQLALAKALRTKRKLPEISIDATEEE